MTVSRELSITQQDEPSAALDTVTEPVFGLDLALLIEVGHGEGEIIGVDDVLPVVSVAARDFLAGTA